MWCGYNQHFMCPRCGCTEVRGRPVVLSDIRRITEPPVGTPRFNDAKRVRQEEGDREASDTRLNVTPPDYIRLYGTHLDSIAIAGVAQAGAARRHGVQMAVLVLQPPTASPCAGGTVRAIADGWRRSLPTGAGWRRHDFGVMPARAGCRRCSVLARQGAKLGLTWIYRSSLLSSSWRGSPTGRARSALRQDW